MPRRPDAVISTAPARVAQPSLRRFSATPASVYADVFSQWNGHLALSASARSGALSWDDGPAGSTENQWAAPSVAKVGQACRDINLLPFRRLCGRGRALRTESPADCFSGRGILLLFSGLYSDYWLLQLRSGLGSAPRALTGTLPRTPHHVLPGVSASRV